MLNTKINRVLVRRGVRQEINVDNQVFVTGCFKSVLQFYNSIWKQYKVLNLFNLLGK